MTWRRYDDGYEDHPKVVALIDQAGPWAFYRLGKIHAYCARWNTYGQLTRATARELGVTKTMLNAMISTRLLDVNENGSLSVHHWEHYNPPPTLEDLDLLVAKFITENPGSSANDVCKAIPAKRTAVLASVKRFHSGSPNGSDGGSQTVPGTSRELVSHAGTRAQPRTPSPTQEDLEAQALLDQDAESVRAGATHEPLDKSTLNLDDACHRLLFALPNPHTGTEAVLRSITSDDYAFDQARDECQRVGGKAGLAVTILRRIAAGGAAFDVELRDIGAGSNGSEPARPVLPLFDILTAWITNVGHTDHWPGVELEISDREHRRGETLTDEQRLELHELWQGLQPVAVEPEPP